MLLAAALCVSVAGMTRYIGLVLAPMGALLILLVRMRTHAGKAPSLPRRAMRASVFFVLATAANLAWFIRNARAGESSTGRTIEWHPVNWSHGRALIDTIGQWIVPPVIAPHAWWIIGVAVVMIAAAHARGGCAAYPTVPQ